MKINHLLLLGLSVGLSIQANATKYVYISTAEELASFRDAVNSGGTVTAIDDTTEEISEEEEKKANVILTQDIDLSNESNWIPIGTSTSVYFNGDFNGGNHTISNLYVDGTQTEYMGIGLFGYIYSAEISNLSVTGQVIGNETTGGIVGAAAQNSTITNCQNYCSVTATSNVGGILGKRSNCTISNSINWGNITGTNYVGGITGYFKGTLANCANYGNITGSNYVGGLVGYVTSESATNATSCFNYGNITTVGASTNHGILFGNHNPAISNCFYNSEATYNFSNSTNNATPKQIADFASGAVTYLLNNGTSVWKQTLGTDPYPVFEGGTVYLHELEGDSLYSNASELDIIYHADGTYEPLVWSAGTNYTPADNSFLVTTNTNIGGHNVVLKNSDGTYSCNTFHLIDGQPFHSDFDITVDTLTYNRAATASAIVTMVLPADIPTDYLKGNLYIFSGFDGTNVHFSSFEQETTEANTPYAIKPEDAETTILEDGARNVTIKGTNEINEIVYDNLTNFGEYEVASYISDDHYSYIIFSGGKLKKYKKINLSPFRAGFRLGLDEDITSATLGLMVDNELTGVIVTESEDNLSENVDVFDIQGRLVRANAEPSTCFNGLGKGIYIVNGKKFQVTANTQTAPVAKLKKSAAATTGYAE